MKNKLIVLIAAALAGTTLLTACGSSTETTSSSNSNASSSSVSTTETTDTSSSEKDESIEDAVKNAAENGLGKGEKITDVSLKNKVLTITIDMSGADTSSFSEKDLAYTRISSITDEVLGLDDKYYKQWDSIVLDFGEAGKATLDKSMVTEDDNVGKYFDGYDESILK